MSLNLKKRDKISVNNLRATHGVSSVEGQHNYLLVDKLFLFEGSPGSVGGLFVCKSSIRQEERAAYSSCTSLALGRIDIQGV